jgi:hypothetical protein
LGGRLTKPTEARLLRAHTLFAFSGVPILAQPHPCVSCKIAVIKDYPVSGRVVPDGHEKNEGHAYKEVWVVLGPKGP